MQLIKLLHIRAASAYSVFHTKKERTLMFLICQIYKKTKIMKNLSDSILQGL